MEARHLLGDAHRDYQRAIAAAIHAELLDHPAVLEWLAGRRALGDRKALRRFRNKYRLEQGVGTGMDVPDLWIAMNAAPMIEAGKPVERIRSALLRMAKAPWPKEYGDWQDSKEVEFYRATLRRRVGSQQSLDRRLRLLGVLETKEVTEASGASFLVVPPD